MPSWILDNLEGVLPVIIAILYFISSARGKRQSEEVDPESAERARKIQEDIRRKIMERQSKNAPARRQSVDPRATPGGPPPLRTPPTYQRMGEPDPPRPDTVYPREYSAPSLEELDPYAEQKRQLEEQRRKARELQSRAREVRVPTPTPTNQSRRFQYSLRGNVSARLRQDLGDSASLRKAIVLKEVLDKPVGLR